MSKAIESLLVFDIETFAKPAADQDPGLIQALTRNIKDESEKSDALEKLALNPAIGELACVGLFDPKRERPALFYRTDLGTIKKVAPVTWQEKSCDVQLKAHADETALLEATFTVLARYDCLITYNGRGFDYPFLMQRAFLRNVVVNHHLYANRYHINQHLDLCDYLSGFGAARRLSLDLLSRAAGLTSPKEGDIEGAKVSEAIRSGRFADVADYCMRDVLATASLAKRAFQVFAEDLNDFSSFR